MSGLERPTGKTPAEVYAPMQVGADWPLPEDRERAGRHRDYGLTRQVADKILADQPQPQVVRTLQNLFDSSLGETISEDAALRLAVAQRLADGEGWMVVPQTPQGLPGVDRELTTRTLALDPDAVAENVATIARGTNPDLAHTDATNVTLALQNTEWGGVSPGERANFLAWVAPILGGMGVGMHALPPEGGQ